MDNALLQFGETFIRSVRDNPLFVLEGIISGHMKSEKDRKMHEEISKMSAGDIQLLKQFAYSMVDQTLHHCLFMFETNQDWKIANETQEINNINDISDGLAGELYTEDGWIQQFSKYPKSRGCKEPNFNHIILQTGSLGPGKIFMKNNDRDLQQNIPFLL